LTDVKEPDLKEIGKLKDEKEKEQDTAYLLYLIVVIYFGWGLINTDSNLILILEDPILNALHLTLQQFSYIVSGGFATSFVLSLFLGPLGDKMGRRFVLQLTLLGTAVFSGFQYFINSFLGWFGLRLGAGAFTGGEWGAGGTALAETFGKKYRGLMLSIMQSGWVLGYGLASVISLFAITFYGAANGWRVAFLFAFIPAIIVVALRFKMKNPERYEHLKDVEAASKEKNREALNRLLDVHNVDTTKLGMPSYKQLFSKDLIRMTVVLAFWNFITTGIAITSNTFWPTYFESYLPFSTVTTMLGLVSFAGIIGYILNGVLNDIIGAKYSIMVFASIEVIGFVLIDYFSGASLFKLYAFYIIFFFAENGQFSGLIRMNTESFPTRVRATGALWGGAFWSLGQAVWPLIFGQALSVFGVISASGIIRSHFNNAWLYVEIIPEIIAIIIFFFIMKNIRPKKELEEISI